MERELWSNVVALVTRAGRDHQQRQRQFTDEIIVLTWLWAGLHDRPICWATSRRNWPFYLRTKHRPTSSTMSRRLRSPSLLALIKRVWNELPKVTDQESVLIIDGKPMPVGGYTNDRDARSGRACGCFAWGYKLYLVLDEFARIHAWKVHPMNVSEQATAEELIPQAAASAGTDKWLLGDKIYDSNRLYILAEEHGLRLLTQRMRTNDPIGPKQSFGRARAIEMLERPGTEAGLALFARREKIERFLGTLCCTGGGLGPLPGFVRGLDRVRRWIEAKLLLHSLRRAMKRVLAA